MYRGGENVTASETRKTLVLGSYYRAAKVPSALGVVILFTTIRKTDKTNTNENAYVPQCNHNITMYVCLLISYFINSHGVVGEHNVIIFIITSQSGIVRYNLTRVFSNRKYSRGIIPFPNYTALHAAGERKKEQ